MCGISGFIGQGTREDLENMVASIKHRGPDDEGLFFDHGIAFGHTRLSIIDLTAAGHQPMFNEKKTLGIVFNGEIYNFKELRAELIEAGYVFVSNSDTEVILFLYEHLKEKCFERLNGMFALALYDFTENKLILARDRMGEKPLYWALQDSTIIFGSELKTLMAHSRFKKEIDVASLNKYLLHQYVPTPYTIFSNVYKLEPATYLVYSDSRIVKQTYWNANFKTRSIEFSDALNTLDVELEGSVRKKLISDVPSGVFLSGGLDSSVVAYYAQKNSIHKIKTFSIGFKEASFDESKYAREVANFIGTDHYEKIVSVADCLAIIPSIAEILDEPMADSSILPTCILAEFAKQNVSVVLGGDGGDEIFAGYQTFQAQYFVDAYRKIPKFFRENVIERMVKKIPEFNTEFGMIFFLKKFIEGVEEDNFHTHQNWITTFRKREREYLFKQEKWTKVKTANEFEDTDRYISEIETDDECQKLLYFYMRTFLMDQVMVKVDRGSMHHSLEVRAPFLDHQVVDFVNTLPFNFKMKGLRTKYILKQLMKDKLPDHIIHRSKTGFRVPLASWLREDLRDFCNSVLSLEKTNKMGFFNYEYIEKMKNEHFEGSENNSRKLWTLIVFYLWYERWIV